MSLEFFAFPIFSPSRLQRRAGLGTILIQQRIQLALIFGGVLCPSRAS